MKTRTLRLTTGAFGATDVGTADIAFAVLVSVLAALSAGGITHHNEPHTGVAAALAVLLMTAPVVVARRFPLWVAAALAAGTAFNWMVIGHLVRCGAALPAAFFAAFAVGLAAGQRQRIGLGAGLIATDIVCQCCTDPRLGPAVSIFLLPIAFAFLGAGRLVHSRNQSVSQLRARNAELREQRDANAQLAVAADRARLADDLDGYLRDRVDAIAAAAATGRAAVAAEPEESAAAFETIQHAGRETLAHMRGVVAGLRDAPTEPQPVLAQLDRLLDQVTGRHGRLSVSGDPRLLPPGLELSGFRIVEHLLESVETRGTDAVEVTVTFRTDSLELTVVGAPVQAGRARARIAAATERATVHGGSLRSETSAGRRTTVVRLPVAAGHG